MWLRLLKIYVEIQQGSKHYLYLLYWRLQPNQYLKRNQKMMLTPPLQENDQISFGVEGSGQLWAVCG